MNDLAKEVNTKEPFNLKKELEILLRPAEIFDQYYQDELRFGASPDQVETQVSKIAKYKLITNNKIGDTSAEKLLIPKTSQIRVGISAPPTTPYVIDEFMPQELWHVVKSEDPSKPPTLDELKCVEFSLECKNTFSNNSVRETLDIYRVDLTKDKPVMYRRVPIPKDEQQKHDAMGADDPVLKAMLDFAQPFPRFKYERVGDEELERVVRVARDCQPPESAIINQ